MTNQDKNIISIVTPSFNQGHFIAETIESVLSQSGDFFIDYIIIDGKSNDNTIEVIQNFEQKLMYDAKSIEINGIRFYKNSNTNSSGVAYRWVSEIDTGHANALNKGFKLSLGKVLAWINSDDKYHPSAFEKVMDIFNKFQSVEWLVGKSSWWNKQGKEIDSFLIKKNFWDFASGNYQWIQQESTFWRRSIWEKSGGFINESYKFMVDNELWSRFFLVTDLYMLDEKIGGYRVHDTNRAHINNYNVLSEMSTIIEELNTRLSLGKKIKVVVFKILVKLARTTKTRVIFPDHIRRLYGHKVIAKDILGEYKIRTDPWEETLTQTN